MCVKWQREPTAVLGFVGVVDTVVAPVTDPLLRDAAVGVTGALVCAAGVGAVSLVCLVTTVLLPVTLPVCRHTLTTLLAVEPVLRTLSRRPRHCKVHRHHN